MNMYKVLTIAGSDCSGGAGIQADIKTITAHGMYAMSAITSLIAQNTTGVYGVMDSTPEILGKQLDCIFNDIFPDAVKIGMVSDKELINIIAEKLKEYKPKNIVLDTVMVATSGSPLLKPDSVNALIEELIPLATVITPNIPEAEVLGNCKIECEKDLKDTAIALYEKYGCNVLVKGGHLNDTATDILCCNGEITEFKGERIDNNNTHGTGCTLSSAIACNLAKGLDLPDAIRNSKEYLVGALKYNLNIGKGNGPLNHCYKIMED